MVGFFFDCHCCYSLFLLTPEGPGLPKTRLGMIFRSSLQCQVSYLPPIQKDMENPPVDENFNQLRLAKYGKIAGGFPCLFVGSVRG